MGRATIILSAKIGMRKSFTIARRDVVDASGHKHAANGQFGSGGSAKAEAKPKKKLGDAAEKHSAAAHESKTHEAHSKAGKAHAAVARAALKRGDIDKATSALAQAKLHRDEAKRLKSAQQVDTSNVGEAQPASKETQPTKVVKSAANAKDMIAGKPLLGEGASRKVYDDGDSVIKVARNDKLSRTANKDEATFSEKSPLFAKITEIGPNGTWIRQEKLTAINGQIEDGPKYADGTFKESPASRKARLDDSAAAEVVKHFGIPAEEASQKFDVKKPQAFDQNYIESGKNLLYAAVQEADNPGSVKNLPKSASKLVDAIRQIKKDVPEIDVGDFAYAHQWGLDKTGKPKIADYSFTHTASKAQMGRRKFEGRSLTFTVQAKLIEATEETDEQEYEADLDSEIADLEKALESAQPKSKRFTLIISKP